MFVATDMTDAQFAKLYDSRRAWRLHNRDLSRGEIACALSHQSALTEFLKSDAACCLIVEDDVMFSPAVGGFLKGLEAWLVDWKEVPVGVVLSEAVAVRYWCARRWISAIRRTRPLEVYGALAYVVNRQGAEHILRVNAVPIYTMSDHWSYYRAKGLRLFGTDKVLAGSYDYHRGDSSLSAGRAEIYRKSLSKRRHRPLFLRIAFSLKNRTASAWRRMTGVKGGERSNSRLFQLAERKDGV